MRRESTDATFRIVGSGPVALACGLWMARAGIDPARIDLGRPGGGANGPRRLIAMSDGSRQLLSRVISMPTGGRIERIEVLQDGTSGRTRIEARDFGVGTLGTVVDWHDLVRALGAAAAGAGIAQRAGDAGSGDCDKALITIHAEGMPRPEAACAGDYAVRTFDQHALLTEAFTDAAPTTAFECFGAHGPLALLPAAPVGGAQAPARHAVVWCDTPERTARRAALSEQALSAALDAAFSSARAIGGAGRGPGAPHRVIVCAPVTTTPLVRVTRRRIATDRDVWIGNAAQALHPVAGQGLNLGLRDAFELATLLGEHERAGAPEAPGALLRRFEKQRRRDRGLTIGVTDLMARAFTWPLARPLQSVLLTALDLSPALRRPLAAGLLFGQR